jgi:acetyltransferase, GNAT family
MSAEISISPYKAEDFDSLAVIHDEARRIELETCGLSDAFIPFKKAAFLEGLFDYEIFTADYNGDKAGFIAFNSGEIAWLYVKPEFSRRGVGRELIRFALEKAGGGVSIEVLCGNKPALDFYRACGFEAAEALCGKMPGNEAFSVNVFLLKKR